jgi:hypothetical protein
MNVPVIMRHYEKWNSHPENFGTDTKNHAHE